MTKIKIKLFMSIITGGLGIICLYSIYKYIPNQNIQPLNMRRYEKIKDYINVKSSEGCNSFYKAFKLNADQNIMRSHILGYDVFGGVKNIQISESMHLRITSFIINNNRDYKFSLYLFENTSKNKCYGSIL